MCHGSAVELVIAFHFYFFLLKCVVSQMCHFNRFWECLSHHQMVISTSTHHGGALRSFLFSDDSEQRISHIQKVGDFCIIRTLNL